MKTAEVAIEHLITGMLVLFAFLAPFVASAGTSLLRVNTEGLIGVFALAYVVGIVFDKIADTALGPFEQMIRLGLAQKQLPAKATATAKRPEPCDDPFPQDALEYYLRAKNDGRLDWMDALRSRIRVCRGLAVLGLPAAVGASAFLGADAWRYQLLAGATLALLLLAVALSTCDKLEIPKTYDAIKSDGVWKPHHWKTWRCSWPLVLYSAICIAFVVSDLHANGLADRGQLACLTFAGLILSLLATWAWWRICTTYLRFVLCAKPTRKSWRIEELVGGGSEIE